MSTPYARGNPGTYPCAYGYSGAYSSMTETTNLVSGYTRVHTYLQRFHRFSFRLPPCFPLPVIPAFMMFPFSTYDLKGFPLLHCVLSTIRCTRVVARMCIVGRTRYILVGTRVLNLIAEVIYSSTPGYPRSIYPTKYTLLQGENRLLLAGKKVLRIIAAVAFSYIIVTQSRHRHPPTLSSAKTSTKGRANKKASVCPRAEEI